MHKRKALLIATIFGLFQGLMPLIGWICVHTLAEQFAIFEKFIPYIALALLSFIGGKMLYEGLKKKCDCEDDSKPLTLWLLIVQGIATSIDALSVGLDIGHYNFTEALMSSFVIAFVTFIICMFGVWAGKKFGNMLSNKATVFGGVILVGIGIYIFIKGILGI
jgi:putative Mn2+ efflux pump MntP